MANIADIADKENKTDIAKKADIAESIFSRQKYPNRDIAGSADISCKADVVDITDTDIL